MDKIKQRITESNFNELTNPQKERWLKWCWAHNYTMRYEYGDSISDVEFGPKDILGFPSIGEMIEFLDEKAAWFSGVARLQPYSWSIGMLTDSAEDHGPEFVERYCNRELCDALWEGVKEILEAKTGK